MILGTLFALGEIGAITEANQNKTLDPTGRVSGAVVNGDRARRGFARCLVARRATARTPDGTPHVLARSMAMPLVVTTPRRSACLRPRNRTTVDRAMVEPSAWSRELGNLRTIRGCTAPIRPGRGQGLWAQLQSMRGAPCRFAKTRRTQDAYSTIAGPMAKPQGGCCRSAWEELLMSSEQASSTPSIRRN